jgi:hypothetical protein
MTHMIHPGFIAESLGIFAARITAARFGQSSKSERAFEVGGRSVRLPLSVCKGS